MAFALNLVSIPNLRDEGCRDSQLISVGANMFDMKLHFWLLCLAVSI
jgi:hypothetical protein